MINDGQIVEGVRGQAGLDIRLPNRKQLTLLDNQSAIIALVDSMPDRNNRFLQDIIIGPLGEEPSDTAAHDFHGTAIAGLISAHCSFTMNAFSEELYVFISQSRMLFVCAAGNNNRREILYPARYDLPNVLSVMATDNKGNSSKYSNYSAEIDLAAPGENVLCLAGNSEFATLSGSSFATAFVSAACAYIIDRLGYCAADAKEMVLSHSIHLSSLDGKVRDGSFLSLSQIVQAIEEIQNEHPKCH